MRSRAGLRQVSDRHFATVEGEAHGCSSIIGYARHQVRTDRSRPYRQLSSCARRGRAGEKILVHAGSNSTAADARVRDGHDCERQSAIRCHRAAPGRRLVRHQPAFFPVARPSRKTRNGILPAYRGKGLGRRLIETTLRAAQKSGFARVELDVYEDNARAISTKRWDLPAKASSDVRHVSTVGSSMRSAWRFCSTSAGRLLSPRILEGVQLTPLSGRFSFRPRVGKMFIHAISPMRMRRHARA